MLRIIKSLIKQYIFWLLVFAFVRMLFLLVYAQSIWLEGIAFSEILSTFYYALILDSTTASFFLIIPFFILFLQTLISPQWLNNLNKVYTGIVLFIFVLINVVEFGLYAEWRTKLSFKAFHYLNHLDEIANTAQTGQSILLLLILGGLVGVGIFIYKRYFFISILRIRISPIASLFFLLFGLTILFTMARGGFKNKPINQSAVYFSKHQILNNGATNSAFNLFASAYDHIKNAGKNPFLEMPSEKAQSIVKQLLIQGSDSIPKILNNTQPNIVLLILESWSADLIESLGGEPGITPFFHSLEKEGLLFDNFYASGSRSEQGMLSIFSGMPAHPISSITVHPEKYSGLPSWIHQLNEKGYLTSFYFGGQLIYGDIKNYILYNEFDSVKEIWDYDPIIPRGKLGIHDEFTLLDMAKDLNQSKEPFFSALFTMSSHSPYDQPKPDIEALPWGNNERKYINSAYYTDQSLKKFFEKARQSSWYENTLFLIVADHSHNSYRNHLMQSGEYNKIPLLFYGPVLKPELQGKVITHLGYQPDIAATLLPQLNMDSSDFQWSKNLLDSCSSQFSYAAYEEGFVWIRPAGQISFEKRLNYYYKNTAPKSQFDSISQEGKAFLQMLFQDFMNR